MDSRKSVRRVGLGAIEDWPLKQRLIHLFAIAKWHICLGYGVVGVLGMGLVIAKTVKDVLDAAGIVTHMRYLYPLGIFGLWLAGFLYDKLGFYSRESSYGCERNAYYEKHVKGSTKND